ncbi:MAG TPA: MFS transporter [Dissulfurispiraceae bacterium]|nr:MFS transporter [Dissulfurispiraceae bacterium]
MSSQFSLLRQRRFLPFFLTQFFGAFNDNVFKNSLIVLITFQAAHWTTMQPAVLANLFAGVFILPFFLFSATAGQLADKYDKARIARIVKVFEICIMLVACVGFALESLALLFFVLFLLGFHSTVFGPVKYAILPQHLTENELIGGNALVEAGTFIAILLGTLVGGLLAGASGGTVWISAFGLCIALIGYIASRSIPAAPPPEPALRINPNPVTETWRNLGFAREKRVVFMSIVAISWFWLYGALFLTQFPAYAKNVLGGTEDAVAVLLATFTLGIGFGSLACERISGHRIETGIIPLGAIGMTVFGLDFYLASPSAPPAEQLLGIRALFSHLSTWRIMADLILIGFFGGLFCVPLYAVMQTRSDVSHRARIIAANNIMNALFIVTGTGAAAGLLAAGLSLPGIFGIAALANAAIAAYVFIRVPEFPLSFLQWIGWKRKN